MFADGHEEEQLRVLAVLVIEGWKQSSPHAPQKLHMVR
jgi:hypothetical protein